MGAKKYYWLKLKNDFFTNKKIKKLRKIAGGDTYTIIYLKMQLLSITNEGRLYFDNVEESFAEELALELDEDIDNVKVTIMFLIKNGLLVEVNQEEYMLPETMECIGSETNKAELMRRKRAREKALTGNNVTTMLPTVTKSYTEIEKEKEIEKDIDIELEEKKKEELKNNSPKTTTKRFIKPSLEEVKAYCLERNNAIDPEQFIDYYECNGWKVGKNPMKDWKAAVRTWERRNTTTSNKTAVRQEVVPEWINKEQKSEPMTSDEKKEMDDILNKYKPNPELEKRLKEKYGKGRSND